MTTKKDPNPVPSSALIDGIDPRSLMMHRHHFDVRKTTRYTLTPEVVGTMRTVLRYLASEYEATAGSLRQMPDASSPAVAGIIRGAEQSADVLRSVAGRLSQSMHVFTLAAAENALFRWLETQLIGEVKRKSRKKPQPKDGE